MVVMAKNIGDQNPFEENNRVGPDYIGFYTSEIVHLLAEDVDLVPFPEHDSLSGKCLEVGREEDKSRNSCRTKEKNRTTSSIPLYSNGIGALLSEFKKERLKLILRQCAFTLNQEIHEAADSTCRIQSLLRGKEFLLSSSASTCKDDELQHPTKKLKVLRSCLDQEGEKTNTSVAAKESYDDLMKKCSLCQATRTPQWRHTPDGLQFLCNACGIRSVKTLKNGPASNSDSKAAMEDTEIDDDLQILLESDRTKVEELIKKHSNELCATLHYMEKKLEELLDNAMTSCRPMTLAEKLQLRRMIQNLPPKNLDRVAEILGRNTPSGNYPKDEIYVELDGQDKVTLWRLYFYIKSASEPSTH